MARWPLIWGLGLLPLGLWAGVGLLQAESPVLLPSSRVSPGPAWFHGPVVVPSRGPLIDARSGVAAARPSAPPAGEARYVSPDAALAQVARVARARRQPEAELRALVQHATEWPGLMRPGPARVDLLALNCSLAAREASTAPTGSRVSKER